MAATRVNLSLSASQTKVIDRIAKKYGMDRTNAIRYCIGKIAEMEINSPLKLDSED